MRKLKLVESPFCFMGLIPKTLREFTSNFEKSLSENIDSTDFSNSPHLKVQLIESNIAEIPRIDDFSDWKPFEDTHNWYFCTRDKDYIVLNKYSTRIWAVYSLMKVASFSKIIDSWIRKTLYLDKCWIPSSRIKKIGNGYNWIERGIGLKYHDLLADDDTQAKVSLKAWYGPNEIITKAIGMLQDNFAVSSYRFKDNSSSSVSEWYSSGKITFNSTDDSEIVLEAVSKTMKYYYDEITRATELRDQTKSCFEFCFNQNIDLERYSDLVNKGKSDLQLWMIEVESLSDFKRYRGVDMHTWDRIFLDLGKNYAYMTIPGNGCVNAAPRLVSIQGETIMGKTQIYYNGDEVFD